MPRILHNGHTETLSVAALTEELAAGALPSDITVHHPPWTGDAWLPAMEVEALWEALSSRSAVLARRLQQPLLTWRTVALGAALLFVWTLATPTAIDLLAHDLAALLHRAPAPPARVLPVFLVLLAPAAVVEPLRGLTVSAVAGLAGGLALVLWGGLGDLDGVALLACGGACGIAWAAMGGLARLRADLPPLRADRHRGLWWTTPAATLLLMLPQPTSLQLLLLAVAAVSFAAGWLTPEGWPAWVLVPALPLIALVVVLEARLEPSVWMPGWRTQTPAYSGASLLLPGGCQPMQRLDRDVGQFEWRSRCPSLGLVVEVEAMPQSRLRPPEEQRGYDRSRKQLSLRERDTVIRCRYDHDHRLQNQRMRQCAHILSLAEIGVAMSEGALRAAWQKGRSGADLDLTAVLFLRGEHTEGWRMFQRILPNYAGTSEGSELLELAVRHGECDAARLPRTASIGQIRAAIEQCAWRH